MGLFLAPDWFKDTYIGIEVEQFIGIGVLVVVASAANVLVTQALKLFVHARAVEEDREFWQMERKRLDRALSALLVAITVVLGFPLLEFGSTVEHVVDQIATLFGAGALVWLGFRGADIFTDVLARRAEETESRLDDQFVPLLNTTLKGLVVVIGILFVLGNLGVNVTSLIAGLGLGGLAIALAAQDTFKNLLGGVTIFADRPFQVGDWVVLGNTEGTVEFVGFRSSRVRTFYNSLVTVPNARIVDSYIDNMGLRQWRRYKTTLGLAYHTTPDQMQAFVEGIRALIRASPGMRKDYYIVEFHGFGASSLDVLVYCFIDAPDWNAELRTRHVLNLDIMRLAEDLGIEFAFPTQTLHVASTPEQPEAARAVAGRVELGEIVEGYSPNGSAGQRVDQPITAGYDNTPDAD